MNLMQNFALARIAVWSELVVTGSPETCQGVSLAGWELQLELPFLQFALNLGHACAALL